MIHNIIFILLFVMGFYAVLVKKNLIKMVIGISIMEAAGFYWIIAQNDKGGELPFYQISQKGSEMIDALPQALTLTGIVIGASTTALLLTLIIELNKFTDTINIKDIKGLDD